MSAPKRLLDGDGTELEKLLVASGRAARPKATARWKTEALFLLASFGLVANAKAALPLGAKAYAWALTRYLALGLGAGVTGWSVAHVLSNGPSVTPAAVEVGHVAHRRAQGRTAETRPVETEPAVEPQMAPSTEPTPIDREAPPQADRPAPRAPSGTRIARSNSAASPPATPSLPTSVDPAPGGTLAAEIQELDRARQALARGEPHAAIAALDRYGRAHSKGTLQQEALRLRIEALVAAGDRPAARALLDRFRSLYPSSPHAKRMNSLVNEP
jgi:hypothetical protein